METAVKNSTAKDETPKRNYWKYAVLAVGLIGLVAALVTLPVRDWLVQGLDWTESLGVWGPVFVVLFYIAACVFFLPGSILTLGAGFIFGVVIGTITVSIGSTLGAAAAFLVGRTIARDWIAAKIADSKKFTAIDDAVGKEGFKMVLLTRLSPIFPFNMLNYAYGLTGVSFWSYLLASWIGMLPGTVMYVYLGAGLKSLAEVAAGQVQGGPAQRIFFWVGMVVTVGVAVFVTRIARKAVKEAVPQVENEEKENKT